MKTLLMHLAAACCLAAGVYAQESTIGVYVDAAGTQCTGTTTGGVVIGSIWVDLAGVAAGGFTGAEFRIDNSQMANTTVSVSPDPNANIVLGDAFNQAGTNIVYPTCQTGPRVRLATFTLVEMAPVSDIWLQVTQKYTPTNWTFNCPLLTLCDGPVYTAVCVGERNNSVHWTSVLNPSVGISAACLPVSVTNTSWSQVKDLYRN
ncbi:MAG TPA: hypothetical protein VFD07_06165 [Candidatus Krumholzibacteria bacterium]|nr:hypothetical protein [Candidatus Krumholzibacteria bacterium]